MRGKDFLQVAETLLSNSNEAQNRSAISRGYYGVFHTLSEFIKSLDIQVAESSEAHKQMVRQLLNCGEKDAEKIGRQVDSLRSQRNDADYKLSKSLTPNTCKFSVETAKKLINDVQGISANSALRDKIKLGINAYEEKLKPGSSQN